MENTGLKLIGNYKDVRHKTALLEEKYLRFQKYYKYKGLIVTLLI